MPRSNFKFMLIGIDASRANRKFKSGAEWYSYNLIRELGKIDSINQYILYSDQPLVGGLADLVKADEAVACSPAVKGWQEIISPHGNFRAKILNWPIKVFWTQIRLSYEMLMHQPDVLFIPAHVLPIIHPKKSVVTIHDIGFERQAELYSADKIGPSAGWQSVIINFFVRIFTLGKFRSNILDYHSWSAKFAIRHAKIIIAVSEFTKREMLKVYQARAEKIKVVYNGFNADLYRQAEDQALINQALRQYGIAKPYIFYVGRLEKKKNTARLVEAFALLKQKFPAWPHQLVLAGQAGLGYDEIKYVIEEFDLENDIIITGWIPEADLPYLYQAAALFVLPSLYEGFGIPLLEAMACGVPIAAAQAAAIPEVAQDAAELFNPLDKNDLAETMAEILSDRRLADELVKRGLKRVKDFSLEKCARETVKVMESL